MITAQEDLSSTKKRISIEIPASAFDEEIRRSLDYFRNKARIPGFRPGKTPLAIIEKRFGKDAEADAMEKVIPKYYSDALKTAGIVPVSQPQMEGGMNFERSRPMTLTFTVEVRPGVDVRYEGLSMPDIPLRVEDKDIDDTLERLRQERANFIPSEDPASDGDILIMDYESKEDSKSFKDEVFKIGSAAMPKNFSDALTGRRKGDKVTVEVEFPEDFYSKDVAGQKRTFDVTVKDIKRIVLPEADDEFAKDMELENLAALRSRIRTRLEDTQRTQVERIQKASLVSALIKNHEFDPPQSYVDSELEQMLGQERARMAAAEGAETVPFDEAARRETLKSDAVKRAKASVLLDIIGERESVSVSEEDMKRRILELSMQAKMPPENIMKYYVAKDGSLDGLRQSVFEEKVMDIVRSKAVAEALPAEEAGGEK